ncbi:MAG TPA: MBL fold metallo-hydrolase [Candidatus Binataceae bacterium]|nr:MBL fold metallo-hydrolase [Candidatus Binataceae bacterium]
MRKALSGGDSSVVVTFLGTGDAFASRGRFQSGYMIESDGCRVLMEAGPTVLCAMKRMNFAPADIDVVLISHLHGDHFGGLPFLILEYLWESPRKRPLTIAGPRHLEERAWKLFNTMFPFSSGDIDRLRRNLRFVVLEPGCKARLRKLQVETIRTPHMKRETSLAMRLSLDGRTIVFTGDSGWTDDLVRFTAGADLFMCECTYYESTQLDFHLNYPLIAEKRATFDVGRMVLTHLGREVFEHESNIDIELAFDGMKIQL